MTQLTTPLSAVFLDLDGTLLDTAPDLKNAINEVLQRHGREPVDEHQFRNYVFGGSVTMLSYGFNIEPEHPDFDAIREEFLDIYHQNIAIETTLFDGMEDLLDFLEEELIPWGIITNKPAWLTDPLLQSFGLDQRSSCIISGDTLDVRKPHPDPLLYACQLLGCDPQSTVYIGDTEDDISAARAAGMQPIGVRYGYHSLDSVPTSWDTDTLVDHPHEIIELVREHNI